MRRRTDHDHPPQATLPGLAMLLGGAALLAVALLRQLRSPR